MLQPVPSHIRDPAKEGVEAHKLAELKLAIEYAPTADRNKYIKEYNRLISTGMYYGNEMERMIDIYVGIIRDAYKEYSSKGATRIAVEYNVKYPWDHPNYGRVDAIILTEHTIHVFDLKYGETLAPAMTDSKLIRYGYATLIAFDGTGIKNNVPIRVKDVNMTIVQPRLNFIDTHSTKPEVLKELVKKYKNKKSKIWSG